MAENARETPFLKRARAIMEDAKVKYATERANQTPSTSSSSLPPPRKRLHLAISRSPSPPAGPDPYTTLPPPTTEYITLRLQPARFTRVSRIVRVPLTYTFAHLHTLVRYLFGWKRPRHVFRVYTHVTMYAASNRPKAGHMKRFGCAPPIPASWLTGHHDDHIREFWELDHQNSAWWEVVPVGQGDKDTIEESMGFGGRGEDYRERKEDDETTLGMVWYKDGGNLSEGQCTNKEIGIAYAASWDVHITLESDNELCTVDPPSNMPILVKGQGAEIDPKKKTIHRLFYEPNTFARYCSGELGTGVRPTKLDVFNVEEERVRVEEYYRRKEERRVARQQRRAERAANGTVDDDEDKDWDDDESVDYGSDSD